MCTSRGVVVHKSDRLVVDPGDHYPDVLSQQMVAKRQGGLDDSDASGVHKHVG